MRRLGRLPWLAALAILVPACSEADITDCIKTIVRVEPAEFEGIENVVLKARVTTSNGKPVPFGPVRFVLDDTSDDRKSIISTSTKTDADGVAEASFADALDSFAGRKIFDADRYTVEFGHDVMPLNACRSKATASFRVRRG